MAAVVQRQPGAEASLGGLTEAEARRRLAGRRRYD
jgi:hypothetical protein